MTKLSINVDEGALPLAGAAAAVMVLFVVSLPFVNPPCALGLGMMALQLTTVTARNVLAPKAVSDALPPGTGWGLPQHFEMLAAQLMAWVVALGRPEVHPWLWWTFAILGLGVTLHVAWRCAVTIGAVQGWHPPSAFGDRPGVAGRSGPQLS